MTTRSAATPLAPPLPTGLRFTEEDLDLLLAALPEKARERQADIRRFWRELPRLLDEGHQDRVALLHDGELISLWDSLGDATQAGYDRFGPEGRFLTSPVSALEFLRLRQYLARLRSQPCPG